MSIPIIANNQIFVNDHQITQFGKDSVGKLTFPTELFNVEATKSGTTIAAKNVKGFEVEVELHVIRSTGDDKYLQGILDAQSKSIANLQPLSVTLIKTYADKKVEEYFATNGMMTHNVETEVNTSGNVEQNIAVYKMKFGQLERKYV